MKRILSVIVAVLLLAGMLSTTAFATGTLIYGDAEVAAKPGDTVSVNVYISGNTGFDSAKMTVSAASPLSIVDIVNDGIFAGDHSTTAVNHASGTPVESDGRLYTILVKVADDAESGVYNVSLNVVRLRVGGKELTYSVGSGSVKVTAPEKPTEPQPTETEPQPTETEPQPTETEPKPTETEPQPTETEPKPTETEPKPTETEPKPTETEPKPTETEPKPTETEPTETEPTETEPTQKPTTKPTEPKPTKPGKDEQPKNGDVTPYPVFFLLAVMAVAATAFVLKRKFDV